MKLPKDTLNAKYVLQHLGNYAKNAEVFIPHPQNESKIAPVVSIQQINLKEYGFSVEEDQSQGFLFVSGDDAPLTVEELTDMIKKFPKKWIAVMKTPEENGISTVVSSQTVEYQKDALGFSLCNTGKYNSVMFGYSED